MRRSALVARRPSLIRALVVTQSTIICLISMLISSRSVHELLQLEDVVRTRATLHAGCRRRCGQRHAVEDLRHHVNVDASDGKSQTKTPDMVIGYRLSVIGYRLLRVLSH